MLNWMLLLWMTGCDNDADVKSYYIAPELTIEDPGQVYAYSDVTLTAQIIYQNDVSNLNASWTIDGVAVCDDAQVAALEERGISSCTFSTGEEGNYSVGLIVSDNRGSGSTSLDLTVIPNPLAVQIDSPSEGEILEAGENIYFLASIIDDRNDPVQVTWTSEHPDQGTIDMRSEQVKPADGDEFVYNDLPVGAQVVKVTVEDADGHTAKSSQQLEVNDCPSAPEISIGATTSSENLRVEVVVESQDLYTPQGGAFGYSYSWYKDGVLQESLSDVLVPSSLLSRGEEWEARVIGSDGFCASAEAGTSIVIANSPPVINTVNIDDANGVSPGGTVACTVDAEDPDGDSLIYTFSWSNTTTGVTLAENALTSDADSYTLPISAVSEGDSIQCEVVVSDGLDSAGPLADVVTADNAAPIINSVQIIPAAGVTTSSTVYCVGNYTEPDGQAISESFLWTNDTTGAALGTASSLSLSAALVSAGDTLRCDYEISDGVLSATDSTSIQISNNAPSLTVSLSPLSGVTTSSTVSCAAAGIDPDGDSLSYAFNWSNVTQGTSLTGVTSGSLSSLVLDASTVSVGDSVQCEATVSDGNGGTDSSALSVVIANTAPVASVSVGPVGATSSDTLTCTATVSDADNDSLSYSFSWENQSTGQSLAGVDSGSSSSLTLNASTASAGHTIVCSTTVDDGNGGIVSASGTLEVGNTEPVFTASAAISPNSGIYTTSSLSCTAVATDPDGGVVSLSYQWVNQSTGMILGGNDFLVLNPYLSSPDDEIQCTVVATDDGGASLSSTASVILENSPPVVDSVEITPADPNLTDLLSCEAMTSDADQENLTLSYVWTKISDGSTVGSQSTLQIDSSFAEGEEVQCEVTAVDAYGDSASGSASVTLSVSDQAPVISAVSISPSSGVMVGTEVSCTVNAVDPEGLPVFTAYSWEVNGSQVAGGDSLLLEAQYASRGDDLTCTASVTDLAGNISSQTSAAVTLENATPTIASAEILVNGVSGLTPKNGDSLSCQGVDVVDADGDAVTETIEWYLNGAWANTGSSFAGSIVKNDEIACEVTVSDAMGTGEMADAALTVGNQAPVISAVSVSPDPAYTDSLLAVTIQSSDVDGDAVFYSYGWYVDGALVASSATLDGSSFAKGQAVYVAVIPSDGDDNGTEVQSAVLTINNSTPSSPQISISPDDPLAEVDDIFCIIDVDAVDADNDTISYTYTWYEDGVVTGYTGDSVPAAEVQVAEEWTCEVSATDGTTSSSTVSASVTISPPIRNKIYVCGSSSADTNAIVSTTPYNFSISSSCSPDADTQAMFVPRSGASSFNTSDLQNYVNNGGIVISEFTSSDEVFSAVFGFVSQGPRYDGGCSDNFVEVYQYNSSDPFWQELGWPGQNYEDAGCGYTIGSYPGITPLSGWDSGSVSVGYRDSGAGRVWLADFDWQDGSLSTRTQQVLGYMLSHRN